MPLLSAATDFVQLPADSSGKKVGFLPAASGLYLPAALLVDSAGNTLDAATAAPAGTERGLIVRPIAQDVSASGTLTAAGATGSTPTTNTTAGSFIGPLNVAGHASAIFTIVNTGAAGGNVEIQVSHDGTTWFRVASESLLSTPGNSGPNQTATATLAAYIASVAGWNQVRVMASTAPSSNITASLRLSVAPYIVGFVSGGGANTLGAVTLSGTSNTVQVGNTQNTSPLRVSLNPETGRAPTSTMGSAAASTNATSVKASAGTLFHLHVYNQNAAARFFKLYNKASAPTVGTDVPVMVVAIPASSEKSYNWPAGIAFSTGIAFAVTTGAALTDATALTANDVQWALGWV